MLYPRSYIDKDNNKFLDRFKYFKEDIVDLLKKIIGYSSFKLFMKQKFHF